jgi:Ca2+-transporting ATPase
VPQAAAPEPAESAAAWLSPAGLSEAEAAERLRRDGPNLLPDPERRGFGRILFEIVREPMFALLLAGGVVYLALGEPRDSIVLLLFATLSVSIAVMQEVRGERVLERLRELTAPVATVIREGARRRISAPGLVVGDLIAVSEGDRVPADAVLRSGQEVQADESLLTGESLPVDKRPTEGLAALARPGGDATPFLYSGSLLVRGQGLAEVAATGARTEIGRIGRALQQISAEPARITLETRAIVRVAGLIAFALSTTVVLILGIGRGEWLKGLLGGIALGMAMLPEEFPLVLTVFLVMGAWRISRAGVLTRKASAIETLGAATVLCTDKTGTLTQNRMAVQNGWIGGPAAGALAAGEAALRPVIRAAVLASAPHPYDPMERAFHDGARSWFALPEGWRIERAYGLRPDLLAVTQVWISGTGERRVAAKGAPEAISELCRLDGTRRAELLAAAEGLAVEGARVLATAEGRYGDGPLPETARAFDLELVGLAGLADPVREGAPEAVAQCRVAGVRVVMVTGDHPATAARVAEWVGLEPGAILTGGDLASLDDDALATRAKAVSVFARILPEQKLRIVEALRAAGEVTAMTGDGVNDAPALKAADIGVAMGRRGSDVAREAASLVLLEDDFGSIVKAVRLGRRIYDNLQKATGFIIAVHVPIAGLALIPLFFGLPIVLGPVHIAFLEMLIDPVCSIVFEAEREEADVMRRPPRRPEASLFSTGRVIGGLALGAVTLASVAGTYLACLAWDAPDAAARAAAFAALVLGTLSLILVNRSRDGSIAGALRGANPALWPVLAFELILLAVVLGFEPARNLFEFGLLSPRLVSLVLGAALANLAAMSVLKRLLAVRRPPQP